MGRPEITELNGTTKSDEPASITTPPPIQHQALANNQPEIGQDFSSKLLVEDLVISRPWSAGLFNCCENPRNALITTFLPCVTFGQIAEVLDEGNSSCRGRSLFYLLLIIASYSQWIMSTEYRSKLRKKFKLEEEPCTDVATHFFCPCCSLCQEFRELQLRKLDPALGWNGIIAQQQAAEFDGEEINASPPHQFMSK